MTLPVSAVLTFLALGGSLASAQAGEPGLFCPGGKLSHVQQIILSIAPVVDKTQSYFVTVSKFDKSGGNWAQTGNSVSGVAGKNGMAWCQGNQLPKGAQPKDFGETPQKTEGDGHSCMGVFDLTQTFGFLDASTEGIQPGALPYKQLTENTMCIEDPASPYYGKIVEFDQLPKDEQTRLQSLTNPPAPMRRAVQTKGYDPNYYPYLSGIEVKNYNSDEPVKGSGSCVWMHIERNPKERLGSSGCTTLSNGDLLENVKWLKAGPPTSDGSDSAPQLVQLTMEEYNHHREDWCLPSIDEGTSALFVNDALNSMLNTTILNGTLVPLPCQRDMDFLNDELSKIRQFKI